MVMNTMHTIGENHFPVFDSRSTDAAVRAYNDATRRSAQARGWSVFESFFTSLNAPTADGQHVFARTNVVTAQLLLNHIAALLRDEAAVEEDKVPLRGTRPKNASTPKLPLPGEYRACTHNAATAPPHAAGFISRHLHVPQWWCKFFLDT